MKARTRPLADVCDGPVDLNDVAAGDGVLFVRDAVGVAGRGVAARVPADQAVALLAAIEHDGPRDLPGVGPVAIGGVPFRPGAPSDLVVPQVVLSKTPEGDAWVTEIDAPGASSEGSEPANGTSGDLVARARGASAPDGATPHGTGLFDAGWTPPDPSSVEAGTYQIAPNVPVDTYLSAVEAARNAVRHGDLTKAVIARDITVTCDHPIDVHAVLRRLKASFGSSYRFSIDGFIGASPELLVEVRGDVVRSHPLAGTAPRTGDVDNDAAIAAALVESTKDQIEHRIVIDVVHDALLPWCSYLDWQPEPSIVTVANVQHLGTEIEGRLSHPAPSVVELVQALSPTPALGGHPRNEALALIERVEGLERGRYGGAVGWVDAAGNGTWAVAIRCAELSGDRRRARLVAGGGIVADSDPVAELAETQAKFQAMLSALIRA